MKKIKLKPIDSRLCREFPMPGYATTGAAGMDIRACLNEPVELHPRKASLIPTGFAMHLEDTGLTAVTRRR